MSKLYPLGAQKDPEDKRDIPLGSIMPATVPVNLPRQFSLRPEITQIMKVFLQKYGSCVGGSARYVMQYFLHKLAGRTVELSERFLYGRAKELDGMPDSEGTWPRIMLQVMFGAGAPVYSRWPQEPSPTHKEFIASPPENIREEAILNVLSENGFVRCTSYDELKKAIFLFGPVLVTINVYGTYDSVGQDGRIQKSDGSGFRGSHENIAIGWNDDTGEIELMNQWSDSWGNHGFAFVPLNYDPSGGLPFVDMWAITDMVNAQLTSGAPIELGYPVETVPATVTQGFGVNKPAYEQFGLNGHNGLDFRTKDGNKFIIAADDGEIISCNPTDGGYGMAVRIKHKWGMSIYGHNSKFLVNAIAADGSPTKVKRGDRIAVAGCTGNCQGEHCHFGIRINGVKNPGFLDWVDPTPFFKAKSMTKYFRVQQGTKSGIMILEGFSGTLLFENDWAEYQKLLQISGMTMETPLVNLPDGKFLRVDDHGKLGIIVVDGFAGTVLFENDYVEYKTLLQISGMTMENPNALIP